MAPPAAIRRRGGAAPASGALSAALLMTLLAAMSVRADAAQTEVYSCKDGTGRTISGDLPPPECKEREIRILAPDGTTRRIIPAPLTKEQRRERERAEEEQRRQEELARAQARKDRALLETYGSTDEIEAARRRVLQGQQIVIDRADQRIKQYQRERKHLDNEADFYAKRDMPRKLREQFEANEALLEQQENTRADAQMEMQRINARFDSERKRFQELEEMAAKAAEARERAASQIQ